MEAEQILKQAAQASASDIFIVAGLPVSYKVNNQIQRHGSAAYAGGHGNDCQRAVPIR